MHGNYFIHMLLQLCILISVLDSSVSVSYLFLNFSSKNKMFDQGVLSKGSGNAACSPLALHCGGKSYLGAQLDKEGGHLA